MPERITVERGKFGCYFYDNKEQRSLSLAEVALILNSGDWNLSEKGEEDV